MTTSTTRLTLDLAADLQYRLEAVAARKGVVVGEYCRRVLEEALERHEPMALSSEEKLEALDSFAESRATTEYDPIGPDSTDDIRRFRSGGESEPTSQRATLHAALDRIDDVREEAFGDRVLPGDSTEFIREARDSRQF